MRNIKNIIAIGGVSATMGLAALTGCKNLNTDKPRDERSAGRVKDDDKITKEVREKLRHEPVYKFENVDVKTFAGVVQLSGFVNVPGQKRYAEALARQVDGVTQVVNSLTLKPGPPTQP